MPANNKTTKKINDHLKALSIDGSTELKELFDSLQYNYVNDPLPISKWPDNIKASIDTVSVLSQHAQGFKIIWAKLNASVLKRTEQRPIINQVNRGHPYNLIIFSNNDETQWDFVNVKLVINEDNEDNTQPEKRRIVRRISIRPDEPCRTAVERLSKIEISDSQLSPLAVQLCHDDAFDVEKVTKEFFMFIAVAFTALVGGERKIKSVKQAISRLNLRPKLLNIDWQTAKGELKKKGVLKYPKADENKAEETKKKQEFAVRLVGRLLFCWFLKKKKTKSGKSIIPDEILSKSSIEKYPDYYHSLLEPLFFQVMNKRKDERIKEYRIGILKDIPFLNGGLFEAHDDDCYEESLLTGKQKYNPDLNIPDWWFVDLFSVFESYNFTIDENTSIDIDLSIDPEMLGKIFENLLAEINPKTGNTARKATGSYYTPRPIVEYMVDESLKQYLIGKTGLPENTVSGLLSYTENGAELSDEQKCSVCDALFDLKVIDPACGSGAFPMGVLQKILLILQKIDSDNKIWLAKMLSEISDPVFRHDAKQKLSKENWDYVRKLGIIQKSIYGVDIQSIAVEISKLRFFLSLTVDANIDENQDNWGIEPLPNLEFKFVAANSLIGLYNKQQQDLEDQENINKLKSLRIEYFRSSGKEKQALEKEFDNIQTEMFKQSIGWQKKDIKSSKRKSLELSQWRPFSDESADWFDAEWMFGVYGGFDVVIANPPYGLLNKRQNQKLGHIVSPEEIKYYKYSSKYQPALGGMINIFRLFIVQSTYLLKDNGFFVEIFPLAFAGDSSASKLRNHLLSNYNIVGIEAFPERDNEKKRVFEGVKMSVCILYISNSPTRDDFFIRIHKDRFVDENNSKVFLSHKDIESIDRAYSTIPLLHEKDLNIIRKIFSRAQPLSAYGHCYTGEVDLTLGKKYLSDNKEDAVFIKGAIIDRYILKQEMSQGEIKFLKKNLFLEENKGKKSKHYSVPRIVMQAITGINEKTRLKMTLINSDIFCGNSVNYIVLGNNTIELKYFLALLNSKLINYVFIKFSTNSNVNGYEIDNLPILIMQDNERKIVINLVNKILAIFQENKNKHFDKKDKVKKYEHQIDQMVYKLYNLTPEEIAIVEGKTT